MWSLGVQSRNAHCRMKKLHNTGSKYQLILETEHPLMVGMMGSGSLRPCLWSRDTGDPRSTCWGQEDWPSPGGLTSLLSPQGLSQEAGDSGGCASHYLHAQAHSVVSTKALTSGTPAGLSISSSYPAHHRVSRASGSRGSPDPAA